MNSCKRFIINITDYLSLGLFIYGIVVLAQNPQVTSLEMGIIITYIILEFFTHIKIFIFLLILALLPLLCIILCFYSCFCSHEKKAVLPEPVKATNEILNTSDSPDCSICFSSLMPDEEVIILPCSPKHVFHSICIRNWTVVKPNCPICRHELVA